MNARTPIRVLIVDDHRAVRQSVALSLLAYDDLEAAGEAANGLEALELCPEIKPDVILMDLQMPELDGIGTTALIRRQFPQIKIIALTSFQDETMVQAALAAGAETYLLKSISMDEMANTIRAVYAKPRAGDDGSSMN